MAPLPVFIAVAYADEFSTGATGPCVFACEDATGNPVGEYVVKFRSTIRGGPTGLLFECVAALLALRLGLRTPVPAVVKLDQSLANATPKSEVATKIRDSVGLNFGSFNLTPSYITWPIDARVPLALRQPALDVMAFDALIENVDRRREKPNLLWKGDEIVVIDHELAFSFVRTIGAKAAPFEYDGLNFLTHHPLFAGLKGYSVALDRFVGELKSLDRPTLESLFEGAPREFGREHQEVLSIGV